MRLVEIIVNCPDGDTATRIAERVVAARLAACANIGGAIASIYRWQDAVEREQEVPLLLKTRAENFDAIAAEVAALHPFEVPAITATEFVATPAYRDWVIAETRPGAGAGPS